MHGISQNGAKVAIISTANSVSQRPDTPTNIVAKSDSEWFVNATRAILGKDAGYALHLLTGFEERTCYRYAAGDSKPPAFFLRAILHSKAGEPFLAALMDGSTADWWITRQREAEVGRRVLEITKR
jgi:hypothetical protein